MGYCHIYRIWVWKPRKYRNNSHVYLSQIYFKW